LGDEFVIIGNTTGVYEDVVSEIRIDNKKTSLASKGQLCSIPLKSKVHRGDKLYMLTSKSGD